MSGDSQENKSVLNSRQESTRRRTSVEEPKFSVKAGNSKVSINASVTKAKRENSQTSMASNQLPKSSGKKSARLQESASKQSPVEQSHLRSTDVFVHDINSGQQATIMTDLQHTTKQSDMALYAAELEEAVKEITQADDKGTQVSDQASTSPQTLKEQTPETKAMSGFQSAMAQTAPSSDKKNLCHRDSHKAHKNPNLVRQSVDHLYHLGFSTGTHNLREMFGNTKFILMGGSDSRMKKAAEWFHTELNIHIPTGCGLVNLTEEGGRYAMYKIGPILCVSHGMGFGSISILLHEIFKLCWYAGAQDVIMFRIGTSGGIGEPPGTVVITTEALNGLLEPHYVISVLGESHQYPTAADESLNNQLMQIAHNAGNDFNVVLGKTISTNDFYEGQARTDGALCDYKEEDKMKFLHKVHGMGVKNFEMEATVMLSMCARAGFKAAIVCTTLLDRLKGDQVAIPHSVKEEIELRPVRVVAEYIKLYLQKNPFLFR